MKDKFFNSNRTTVKQRRWLKEYIKTGNSTEAAMKVYKCKSRPSASVIGCENLRKLNYTEFLEAAGITDNLLQQKIMEGLNSSKTVSARVTNKEAGVSTDDFIDIPDFLTRHKYLETALKLKQRLIEKKDITSGGEKISPVLVKFVDGNPDTKGV